MSLRDNIPQELHVIQSELAELKTIKKCVLTFIEAYKYLDVSAGHLNELLSTHRITYYTPNGKKLYFKRQELNEWLLCNRKHVGEEIEQMAANYILSDSKKKGGKV